MTGLEYDPKHPGVRKCTMQIQVSDLNETLVSLKLRMLDQAYLKGHILPVDKNTPDAWRFRSTDWLAEPDELIQEYSIDTTTSSSTTTSSGTSGTSTAAAGSATGGTSKQSSGKSSKAKAKQDKETAAASATATTTAADASTVQSELPSVKYVAKTVGDSVIASDSCELVILEQGRCVKPNEVEIPLYLWIPHDEAMQHGVSYDDAVAAGLEIPPLQSQLDDDALQRVIDADSKSDATDDDASTTDDETTAKLLLKKIAKVAQQGLDTPGKQLIVHTIVHITYTYHMLLA
jgi:hypothetical protein